LNEFSPLYTGNPTDLSKLGSYEMDLDILLKDWLENDTHPDDEIGKRRYYVFQADDRLALRLMGRIKDGRRMSSYYEMRTEHEVKEAAIEWLKSADLEK
jgi:hypothetical protein